MNFAVLLQMAVTALSCIVLCAAIIKRSVPKSLYFTLLSLAICLYAVGYLLEITSPTFEAAMLACRLQYSATPYIAPLFYLFSRDYYNTGLRSRWVLALIFAFPVFFSVYMHVEPLYTPFFKDYGFALTPIPHVLVRASSMYRIVVVYLYVFIAAGLAVIVRKLWKGDPDLRSPSAFFLVAATAPSLAMTLWLLRGSTWQMDLMPLALIVTGVILGWQTLRVRVAHWMPMARDSVLENINDAFILVDPQNRFLDSNAVAVRYFPQMRHAAAGTPMCVFEGFPSDLLQGEDPTREFTITQGESTLHLRTSRSPITYKGGVVCYCIMIYDSTETHRLMAELNELATRDALTGLHNRGNFFKMAGRNFYLALREAIPASVLMLDIDLFKNVNDQYGHLCGDQVLLDVCQALSSRLRGTDIIGRYGGEELVIYLPGTGKVGALRIAESLRQGVERSEFTWEGTGLQLTVSIGVAVVDPDRHTSLEAVIADADEALYRAKASGRNTVRLSESGPARPRVPPK